MVTIRMMPSPVAQKLFCYIVNSTSIVLFGLFCRLFSISERKTNFLIQSTPALRAHVIENAKRVEHENNIS